MASDVAILELEDSDASSRRVRAAIIDILAKEVPEFKAEIIGIRTNVTARKKNSKSK